MAKLQISPVFARTDNLSARWWSPSAKWEHADNVKNEGEPVAGHCARMVGPPGWEEDSFHISYQKLLAGLVQAVVGKKLLITRHS